ncbi:hypothetical protein ACIRG5_45830 [Lentzea sp. NPDC102401]|uniref:hypothetical protein n=1 Tax=Lentzea sp. NPDC102401 TaxID=3364128 RepID=UPI0038041045
MSMTVVAAVLSAASVLVGFYGYRVRCGAVASPISARVRRDDARWRAVVAMASMIGALAAAGWIRVGLGLAGVASPWNVVDGGEQILSGVLTVAALILVLGGAQGIAVSVLALWRLRGSRGTVHSEALRRDDGAGKAASATPRRRGDLRWIVKVQLLGIAVTAVVAWLSSQVLTSETTWLLCAVVAVAMSQLAFSQPSARRSHELQDRRRMTGSALRGGSARVAAGGHRTLQRPHRQSLVDSRRAASARSKGRGGRARARGI